MKYLHFKDLRNKDFYFPIESITELSITDSCCKAVGTAIDLGLSAKWSSMNLGAIDEYDAGMKFSWAKLQNSVGRLSDRDDTPYDIRAIEYKENTTIVAGKHDVATKEWGNLWRLPTKNDLEELIDKCKWEYIENVVNSYIYPGWFKVTGPSGESILLPVETFNQEYRHNWAFCHDVCCLWSGELGKDHFAYSLMAYRKYYSGGNRYVYQKEIKLEERDLLCFVRPVTVS